MFGGDFQTGGEIIGVEHVVVIHHDHQFSARFGDAQQDRVRLAHLVLAQMAGVRMPRKIEAARSAVA